MAAAAGWEYRPHTWPVPSQAARTAASLMTSTAASLCDLRAEFSGEPVPVVTGAWRWWWRSLCDQCWACQAARSGVLAAAGVSGDEVVEQAADLGRVSATDLLWRAWCQG